MTLKEILKKHGILTVNRFHSALQFEIDLEKLIEEAVKEGIKNAHNNYGILTKAEIEFKSYDFWQENKSKFLG